MQPGASDPVRDFIRANRAKYTKEAIGGQLRAAGHAQSVIDEAWRAIEGEQLGEAPGTTARKVRTGWAVLLYLTGLLSLLAALVGQLRFGGNLPFIFVFLILYVVGGLFMVRWIARWAPLTGFGQLMVAIFGVPLLFGALLFGTCVAALPALTLGWPA